MRRRFARVSVTIRTQSARKRDAVPARRAFAELVANSWSMRKLSITLHFPKVMSILKETRDLLLVSCVKGIINANEFPILNDVNISKNPLFPYDNYEEFSLDNFKEEECIAEFCVEKMICPFWQMPLEFHLFSVARRDPCFKEWKACVCCLNDLHIVVVTFFSRMPKRSLTALCNTVNPGWVFRFVAICLQTEPRSFEPALYLKGSQRRISRASISSFCSVHSSYELKINYIWKITRWN